MVHTLEALLLSALLLAPCAAILERCVADGSLFALHPAANALAFLICFPLGIFVMLERKQSADYQYRVALTKAHFALQSLALLLLSAGGAAIFLTKEKYGKPHLTSRHSWAAAATATFSFLNALGGLATTFGGKKTSWQWKNPGHRIGGTLAFIGGGVSVVLGIYSGGWGSTQFGTDRQLQIAGATAAGYGYLLLKALYVGATATTAKPKQG